jgi:molybdenum cofactor guanylyltransferase
VPEVARTTGLILAGGQARRLGGVDKALLPLGQGTVLDQLLARLRPQCVTLAISANSDPARFAAAGCPILPDAPGPSRGPLAGVLAGLDWVEERHDLDWLLTVPGDTPFVPLDLVDRLRAAAETTGHPVARVSSAGRLHPLVALWSARLGPPLRDALHGRDQRRVRTFQDDVGAVDVAWPAVSPDPFFNINTPADLVEARGLRRVFEHLR